VHRVMDKLRARLPGVSPAAISSTLGTRVLALAMTFAAGIITVRGLGVHGRAVLAVMIAVPAVFSILAVFGLDNANLRYAGRSHTAYRQLVRLGTVFSLLSGSALAGSWLLLGGVWPRIMLGLPPRLALLAAAMCPVTLMTTLLGSAEIGRGRITTYNLATGVPALVYFAGVVALLLTGRLSVTNCFIVALGGQVISAIALLVLATVRVHPDGEPVPFRQCLSYALRAYLPSLANYGMLRVDVPVIQLMAGSTAVALYAVALPVAEGLLLMPTAVALVIFPRVTSGAVDARAALRISGTVMLVTAACVAPLAIAAPVVIPAIYGRPFAGAAAVIWAMLPGLVLFSVGRTLQAYLTATDLLRQVIAATAAAGLINIGFLVALTPRYGAIGAACADSAGYLVFTVLLIRDVSHRRSRAHAATRPVRRRHRTAATNGGWPRPARGGFTIPRVPARIAAGLALVLAAAAGGRYGIVSMHVIELTGVAALIIACLLKPQIGLYALAIGIPFSQSSAGQAVLTSRRLVDLIILCLVSHALAGQIARLRAATTMVAIAVIGYMIGASIVIGGDATGSANWRSLLLICAPLLLLPPVVRPGPALSRILLVFSSACAVLAVVQTINDHSAFVASSANTSADGALAAISQPGATNHNAVGALFVMAIAVMLTRYPKARSRLARMAIGAAVVALAVGVAYSLSRASYLGGIAVVTLYAARRSVRGLAMLLIAAACTLPFLPSVVYVRFGSVFDGSADIDSALRIDLWGAALRMFDTHPVFGVGYLNSASNLPQYFQPTEGYNAAPVQFNMLLYAHNTYLTILSQTGLAGAIGVAMLAVLGWRRAWSAARSRDIVGEAALLAMIGIGVCSIFGEVLLEPALLSGFLLIILGSSAWPAQTTGARHSSARLLTKPASVNKGRVGTEWEVAARVPREQVSTTRTLASPVMPAPVRRSGAMP
jgi:O-antigen/teichoic acid export membrane protein/O-antigen ligase